MSDYSYNLPKKKSKQMESVFNNTEHLHDELTKLQSKFRAAMELLHIAFDTCEDEAFFIKRKEKEKE